MPLYDFKCDECKLIIVDKFFKLSEDRIMICCDKPMNQLFLKPPALKDPGGLGIGWTNDGYTMVDSSGTKRNVTEKWEKGKNVLRESVHTDDHRWKQAEKMKDQLNRQPDYRPGISINVFASKNDPEVVKRVKKSQNEKTQS